MRFKKEKHILTYRLECENPKCKAYFKNREADMKHRC
jgi:hypothetical protein